MDKAEKVFSIIFISDNKTTKIMHPSKQAFDTPSLGIAMQWSAVLSFGFDSILFMRRNYFDTILLKFAIKRSRRNVYCERKTRAICRRVLIYGHLMSSDLYRKGIYPCNSFFGRMRGLAELGGLELGIIGSVLI
ncbi:MAG: hypothetical protein ABR936_04585 [Bacteroidota bacterium]